MPSYSRRRTRDQLEDDSDIDTPELSDDSADTQTKRPRLGSRANGAVTNGFLPNGANGGSSLNDFAPGSIVRVTMKNFVTYEHAEFFPGPNLNMVIGPNGTGKSSLVCAICLGLGWGPIHLGRAGSVKEFVKHGKDTATIEIELKKRPEDRLNHTIRTQIRREQNSQKWWLNNKETTHKKIKELAANLRIQVDNLCQFLPQDRVVEFAQCNPVNLLHETLRAAAPEDMLQQQQRLKELHKDKREMSATVQADQDQHRNLETRQQGIQADVERLREREEIQANIERLKTSHVLAQYNEARRAFTTAKQRLKEGEKTLKKLEDESGPSMAAINEQESYHHKVRAMEPAKAKTLGDAEKNSKRLLKNVQDAATKYKEVGDEIASQRNLLEKKKADKTRLGSAIARLKGDLNREPPKFNGADWNSKIREQEHIKRELETDQREIANQMGDLSDRGKEKRGEMKRLERDVENLESEEGRQLNFMQRAEPDAFKAWEWIKDNQDKFQKEVYPPPMLCCSIKDERYSDQVQALLNREDFVCFMAQTTQDYKILSNQLYKVMSLSVVLRTSSSAVEEFRPPMSAQEAQQLDLDAFALDFVEGPEPVVAMLCSQAGLHTAGVTLNEHDEAQYNRLLDSGTINNWVAGRTIYNVRRRREYGPGAISTSTRGIQRGKYWSEQPVDGSEKSALNTRLAEVTHDFQQLRQDHKQLSDKKEEVTKKFDEIEVKIVKLREEKNELQKEYTRWQALPVKLEDAQKKEEEMKEAMDQQKLQIRDLQDQQDKAATDRVTAAIAHATSLRRIAEASNTLLENKLWQVEAESDIAGLKERNAGIVQRLEEEKKLRDELQKEKDTKRREGVELQGQVSDLMAPLDQDRKNEITAMAESQTAEELQNAKEAEEAKLELIFTANPNIVKEFESRAAAMEKLQRKIDASEAKVRTLSDEIEEVKSQWEPRLDALISEIDSAFAHNFEQISCSGEVRVHKDEDFDAWAIDIMVKFRESEELQQLDAHRQSGGERAVSTIFYLMALQSMAQSPFRVVDEINQGMDPRNERMVHERMVDIACREHTSQYFLITPKLLTGLRYDPKMRILCIASGEHMPTDGKKMDFKKCIKIQKGLAAQA